MRPRIRTGLVLAVLALGACDAPVSAPSPDTHTASPGLSASASAAGPEAREIVGGLTSPWGLVALKDGTILVSERDTKKILHVRGSSTTTVRTIEEARPAGEGGLLGLADTPDEKTVFAYYTAAQDNRIVSMTWNGRELGPPSVILTGIPKGGRHNGGRLVVGPDGDLYVGTGDSGDDQLAQDKGSPGGKILRITLDGRPAPGNPFGTPVYSYGHRNVQGLAFDDQGRLWASEFGDQTWDELNLITKGGNYGWPEVEGSGHVNGTINPKLVWKTADASPSGLAYWKGELWMAALRGERLWEIPVEGTDVSTPTAYFSNQYGRLRSVTVSSDDTLLLTGSNTDGRGDPKGSDDQLLEVTR